MSKRDIPNAAELEDLRKKVSELNIRLEVTEQARDKAKADLKTKAEELEKLRGTIDEEVEKATRSKLDGLKSANVKLESELKTANAANAKLESELKTANAANAELKEKLEKALALKEQQEELKKKSDELAARLEAMKAASGAAAPAPAPTRGAIDSSLYTPAELERMRANADAALAIQHDIKEMRQNAAARGGMLDLLS